MSGLVDSLSRKNRHLQRELQEARESTEELFLQVTQLTTDKVWPGGATHEQASSGW